VLNSVIVLVSMAWGILVFQEPLWSIPITCGSAVVLLIGICGMTYAIAPTKKSEQLKINNAEDSEKVPLNPQQPNSEGK